jgi:hypothetical protein
VNRTNISNYTSSHCRHNFISSSMNTSHKLIATKYSNFGLDHQKKLWSTGLRGAVAARLCTLLVENWGSGSVVSTNRPQCLRNLVKITHTICKTLGGGHKISDQTESKSVEKFASNLKFQFLFSM